LKRAGLFYFIFKSTAQKDQLTINANSHTMRKRASRQGRMENRIKSKTIPIISNIEGINGRTTRELSITNSDERVRYNNAVPADGSGKVVRSGHSIRQGGAVSKSCTAKVELFNNGELVITIPGEQDKVAKTICNESPFVANVHERKTSVEERKHAIGCKIKNGGNATGVNIHQIHVLMRSRSGSNRFGVSNPSSSNVPSVRRTGHVEGSQEIAVIIEISHSVAENEGGRK